MSIRRKLFYSFPLLSLFFVIQFGISFYFSQQQQLLVKSMEDEHGISSQLSKLAITAQKIRRFEKEYFIYVDNPVRRQQYYTEFTQARQLISQLLGNLKLTFKRIGRQHLKSRMVAWDLATAAYVSKMDEIHNLVLAGKITRIVDANNAIKSAKNKFRAVLEGSKQAIEDSYRLTREKAQRVRELQNTSLKFSALMLLISVLAGLVVAVVVPDSIARPLRELTEAAQRISKGRINEPVQVDGSAEIADLSRSLQRLQNATFNLIKRAQNPRIDAT